MQKVFYLQVLPKLVHSVNGQGGVGAMAENKRIIIWFYSEMTHKNEERGLTGIGLWIMANGL